MNYINVNHKILGGNIHLTDYSARKNFPQNNNRKKVSKLDKNSKYLYKNFITKREATH